ncbi:MAG: LptE family protein [Porphyromonadaceae bacterium]|nr:LptE family protein [Porphyromonadaceae bacterium]
MQKIFNQQYLSILLITVTLLLVQTGCKISYGFTGGSLDYSKYKSISIVDFPNNADNVVPILAPTFTESLKDKYTRSTKLTLLRDGGDMHLEGEIVGYSYQAMSIQADSYASETKLTLTINVRFTDSKNPEQDFETRYTASQLFDSNRLPSEVEGELIDLLVKEIVDKIYNDTVARW